MPFRLTPRARLAALAAILCSGACAPIRTPGYESLKTRPQAEQSVKPGINDPYLEPGIDVEERTNRFEAESREIYDARREIVEAVGLRRGDAVADIGAGTGLFVEPFARRVGPGGKVYAIDIVPAFVRHVAARAREAGLAQVEARLAPADSVDLPDASIDTAFVCDVYHHFEYPKSSLASIHRALKPGGELVVIDFERIPGVSREWVLGHVRAGKEEFTAEIEAAGFRLVEEVEIDRFDESYFLRFRKR
ncbi:MAG TPA: methyltransferase domain-containing protein [Phycisphaerales bacterium]|nr:methyltransferase domain-containing protein [Phycisphaerales bacterium]